MTRIIALDTETTGLNRHDEVCRRHRIVEIGCVEIINGTITENTFHAHINPQQSIDAKAVKIHGLTNEFLKDKPTFKDIAKDFIDFISNTDMIIIHNAQFDLSFLDQELKKLKPEHQPTGKFTVFDTLQAARFFFPGSRNRLEDLCERFKITGRQNNNHNALEDALLLARVYLKMEQLLNNT